ncbi:MAG: glutamate--tRNA ligase [Gemmatimonadetes bacterium]|nr:MAG: glutamate--tRNA ligase [Gemmatimonadota bacterium]
MSVRVRFAPSPTGFLHIGNVRTAIFNYLFARHHNGSFILRIEDTDQERSTKESETRLIEILKWLGFSWDEGPDCGGEVGPYRQMERLALYQTYAQQLIDSGHAYYCYTSAEELAQLREQGGYDNRHRELTLEQQQAFEAEGRQPVVRFKVPDQEITFTDIIKGNVTVNLTDLPDFVILRANGIPTYNYACVIDDALMKISHVIRGDDHLINTPKQIIMYHALGFDLPEFAHMPMILGQDGSKLSKRDAEKYGYPIYLEQYRDRGYLPEAIINYLSLLSWSSESGEELLSLDQLIAEADIHRIGKSAAKFDIQKLNWMNGMYIREADITRIARLAQPYLQAAGYPADDLDQVTEIVSQTRKYLEYLAQIPEHVGLFFADRVEFENEEAAKIAQTETAQTIYRAFLDGLETIDTLTPDEFKSLMKSIQKSTGIKGKNLWMPVRVGLTGQTHGPDLAATVAIVGKETCANRLKRMLQ